jgi:hypothetical protein
MYKRKVYGLMMRIVHAQDADLPRRENQMVIGVFGVSEASYPFLARVNQVGQNQCAEFVQMLKVLRDTRFDPSQLHQNDGNTKAADDVKLLVPAMYPTFN